MNLAHLKALRIIAENGTEMSHADWTRVLECVADRMKALIEQMPLRRLGEAYRTRWTDGGTVVWSRIPDIRGIYGFSGETLWGLTGDLRWLKVVRLAGTAEIFWISSPGQIAQDADDLFEHVYLPLYRAAQERRRGLEHKLEIAADVVRNFETELNLVKSFVLTER